MKRKNIMPVMFNCYAQACNLAILKLMMKRKNIMPVIDKGAFDNDYVYVCKQLFYCDIIRSSDNLLTPFS